MTRAHAITFEEGSSLTQQNMAQDCDINRIMRRFEETGLLVHENRHPAAFGDFSGIVDYHSACNAVLAAEEAFGSLPARVRTKFANDPGAFLEWVEGASEEELAEYGLLEGGRLEAPEGAKESRRGKGKKAGGDQEAAAEGADEPPGGTQEGNS